MQERAEGLYRSSRAKYVVAFAIAIDFASSVQSMIVYNKYSHFPLLPFLPFLLPVCLCTRVCICVCVCVRACVRACLRARVRART